MKTKLIVSLLVVSIAIVSCGKKEETKQAEPQTQEQPEPIQAVPINEPSELLFAVDTVYEITRSTEPVAKRLPELTGAETNKLYTDYGLVDITTTSYNVQGTPLTVRVLRFPDDMSAYGYVAANRPKLGSTLQLGSESFAMDSVLMFSNGPYAIRVTSTGMNAKSMTAQSLLAEQIFKRFGEATAAPPMFLLFPFSGRVGGTNRYYPKSYLGIDGLNQIYATDYAVNGHDATFFLAMDTTGVYFAALKAHADKTPATQPVAADLGFKEGYAVRFVHPKAGVVVAGLANGKLIGITNFNPDHYQRLLTTWVDGLSY